MEEQSRPWSDLPPEILHQILSWLPLPSHPRFASVCKTWSQATSPVYPAGRRPLLVHYRRFGDGVCRYYDPLVSKIFSVDSPFVLPNTRFYFARDGWLLLKSEDKVYLADPIAGIVHDFPGVPDWLDFQGIAFSGRPSEAGFRAFAIDSENEGAVNISIYDGESWTDGVKHTNNLPFLIAQQSTPASCDGHFYCLGMTGNLGVYDMAQRAWTVLAKPKRIKQECEESYLVESDGELLAVLFQKHRPMVRLLRLNPGKMVWEKAGRLSGRTLFAGSRSSLLTAAPARRMENKVYLPRLCGMPETIEAEVTCSEGRTFFLPKVAVALERGREGSHCCSYSLENNNAELTGYFGSRELAYSIWFQSS